MRLRKILCFICGHCGAPLFQSGMLKYAWVVKTLLREEGWVGDKDIGIREEHKRYSEWRGDQMVDDLTQVTNYNLK